MKSSFVLNIVAVDAGKETSGNTTNYTPTGEGSAKVNGNILIEGINVFLAGLYLDLEKKISVKNADLTVVGTKQDDTINIEGDGSKGLTVNLYLEDWSNGMKQARVMIPSTQN